jgi:vacuolar protein sorting-associated protein 45
MTSRYHPPVALDGYAAIRQYVDRLLESVSGMKVLILDGLTTQIVSAVYSQTEILQKSVYLVTRIEADASSSLEEEGTASTSAAATASMKAVCLLRPTAANVELLIRHHFDPKHNQQQQRRKYSEYHVYFTGFLHTKSLKVLAERDAEQQQIACVREYYADFVPVNGDLWTLALPRKHNLPMTVSAGTSWAPKHVDDFERCGAGITSMLLALQRRPSQCGIRYARYSPCSEELAREIHEIIMGKSAPADTTSNNHNRDVDEYGRERNEELFRFRTSSSTKKFLVLILDRRHDPVTPLLSQWTYQAMIHELLGLNNQRVVLRGAPNISKDLEEVVVNEADDFFRSNKHKNFGELGDEIQRLCQNYQKQTAQHDTQNLNSIEDMQNFLDKFPELRSQSHVVSKHVAIMSELARIVEHTSLMDVSQFEQTLADPDTFDPQAHWRELVEKLESDRIKIPDKLRLGLLYALKYEHTTNLHALQNLMRQQAVPPDLVALVPVILRYGGSQARTGNGMGTDGLFVFQSADHRAVAQQLVSKFTKNIVSNIQGGGMDNVYTQHVPVLLHVLQQVARGKLSAKEFPIVPGSVVPAATASTVTTSSARALSDEDAINSAIIPEEVLVFMVGGITYEEGTKVAEFNVMHHGRLRVVLAGGTIHNSTSFLDELQATAAF